MKSSDTTVLKPVLTKPKLATMPVLAVRSVQMAVPVTASAMKLTIKPRLFFPTLPPSSQLVFWSGSSLNRTWKSPISTDGKKYNGQKFKFYLEVLLLMDFLAVRRFTTAIFSSLEVMEQTLSGEFLIAGLLRQCGPSQIPGSTPQIIMKVKFQSLGEAGMSVRTRIIWRMKIKTALWFVDQTAGQKYACFSRKRKMASSTGWAILKHLKVTTEERLLTIDIKVK